MTTLTPNNPNVATTIAGHDFVLVRGHRYRAERPFAAVGSIRRQTFTVTIRDITNHHHDCPVVATVPGLSYEAANQVLNVFNDGETSFAGRVWV